MSLLSMGTVYGTLLNFRAEADAWAPKMHEVPYKAPPKAPVLYIKPANTWSAEGACITVPCCVAEVEIGATIAMVMKEPGELVGYALMNDLSLPHTSFFGPPVKYKCLDGFLGVGAQLLRSAPGVGTTTFVLGVRVKGELRQTVRFSPVVVGEPPPLAGGGGSLAACVRGDSLLFVCSGGGHGLCDCTVSSQLYDTRTATKPCVDRRLLRPPPEAGVGGRARPRAFRESGIRLWRLVVVRQGRRPRRCPGLRAAASEHRERTPARLRRRRRGSGGVHGESLMARVTVQGLVLAVEPARPQPTALARAHRVLESLV